MAFPTVRLKHPIFNRSMAGRTLNLCLLTLIYCIILTGCAAVQSDNTESINWQNISTIAIMATESDQWDLSGQIEKELGKSGYRVVSDRSQADLLLGYATETALDLGDDSEILTRLKSLHLYFADPATDNKLAGIDYFYPTTGQIDPVDGVIESLAVINRTSPQVEYQPVPEQGSPREPVTQIEQDSPAEAVTTPAEDTAEPVEKTTVIQKPQKRQEAPKQRKSKSPWSIKLKTWGFDTWGKEDMTE